MRRVKIVADLATGSRGRGGSWQLSVWEGQLCPVYDNAERFQLGGAAHAAARGGTQGRGRAGELKTLCLFIIEGTMEAWLEGAEDQPSRLAVGDMIALPACVPHVFRNAGPGQLRLLGIHGSPTRIVHRVEA